MGDLAAGLRSKPASRFRMLGLILFAMTSMVACGPAGDAGERTDSRSVTLDFQRAVPDQRGSRNADGEYETIVRHWKLDMPRAHIVSFRGVAGRGGGDPKHGASQAALITGKIDWERGILEPSPNQQRGYDVAVRLSARIVSNRKFWPIETCLTHPQQREVTGFPETIGRDLCKLDDAKFCTVWMHLDGWGIQVMLPKEQYMSDPQPTCDVVKKFLNERTLVRESVMLESMESADD